MYHLHVDPVPANGTCAATRAHLDPYERGEVPICNAAQPETCQVGDLSGKRVVVVGRSRIVGRPLSVLLSERREGMNATVTLCHSGTKDLTSITREAEILVVRFPLGREDSRRRAGPDGLTRPSRRSSNPEMERPS